VFANWKYNIRKKTNVLKLAEHQTGKNTAPERPLTTLETRLLNFSGEAAVEGFDSLSDYGILLSHSTINETVSTKNEFSYF
jgi:hypothetical protein